MGLGHGPNPQNGFDHNPLKAAMNTLTTPTAHAFRSEGFGIPVLEAIRLGTPVIYDGVQPAGEIMEGRGARQLSTGGTDEMARAFASVSALDLAEELAPESIPTWRDFTATVAHSLSR